MYKVLLVDTDAKTEEHAQVAVQIPLDTIYRNSKTRALDNRYANVLATKTTPLPLGSCFTEGGTILPAFARLANIVGFYFGIQLERFPRDIDSDIKVCELEKTVEIVNYKGKDIVFPIDFK